MSAGWYGTGAVFRATEDADILGALARHAVHHFRTNEAAQTPAWQDSIAALKHALGRWSAAGRALPFVVMEYPMLRLGRRIDAVLLFDRAIVVLEFKRAQADAAALRQAEDYALDLFDFHEESRRHLVLPLLVTGGAGGRRPLGLTLTPGVASVAVTAPDDLAGDLAAILDRIGAPATALDPARWIYGAYRPVPTIIEAACMVYGRNGVREIADARAGQRNLRETTDAIRAAIAGARAAAGKIVLFVTGIPGAGKTLCGLNAALAGEAGEGWRGTFLTGNPTLVHVLREALARDAVARGGQKLASRRHMEGVIQALPAFRNHYLEHPEEVPPESVVVIDEAQRCWAGEYAVRKTRDKPVQLTESEPAHLLDIAARQAGFAAMICLVGGGQEIHDGEGGLAEWGAALRSRPAWRVLAAPDVANSADPRRRLGAVPGMSVEPLLHLDVPIRQIRGTQAAEWVDAVLDSDAERARAIAHSGGVPFFLVRDLDALRRALRRAARGERRAGLLASSGAARLRAEGLGAELPHMDAGAVARWFLDRFPADIRASDALEQVATEFSCQGLELDFAGLCWDADLVRSADGRRWLARSFAGTAWQTIAKPERIANQMNTYRVLLTRARYDTIIWVPRGDAGDRTRDPGLYDGIATFLRRCGARDWTGDPVGRGADTNLEPVLL